MRLRALRDVTWPMRDHRAPHPPQRGDRTAASTNGTAAHTDAITNASAADRTTLVADSAAVRAHCSAPPRRSVPLAVVAAPAAAAAAESTAAASTTGADK